MEDEQVYNAYQSRGIRGYGPRNLWGNEYETPNKIQLGRILFIIILVLAIIAVLIIGVLLWRRRSTSTPSTQPSGGGGGGGGVTPPPTDCTTVGCTGGQVCKTDTKTCVDCLTNTNCSGSTPICDTATNKCKECLVTADCTGTSTCNAGICCNPSAPTINTVTPLTSAENQVTVAYTSIQSGTNYTNLKVEVNIETPAGVLLSTLVKPASGGTVTVTETELNLPNQHLYPSIGYRVRLRMNYSCGGVDTINSDYSAPVAFTMPACPDTALKSNDGVANGADNPAFRFHQGPLIRFFSYFSPFPFGVLIDTNATIHPNQAAIYYSSLMTVDSPMPPADDTYQYGPIPAYPGPVGSTFYFRYFNISPVGDCNSGLSAALPFTRTF